MLKNMRVGTKLVAILVAPLAALGVLAGLGVADRLAGAADARRAERIGEMANRAAEAAQALQLEQLWASVVTGAASANPSSEAATAFDRSASQSDLALIQVREALGDLDEPGTELADRIVVLDDRITTLPSLREAVRSEAIAGEALIDRYQPVLQAVDGLFVGAASEAVAPGIAAYLQYQSILNRAKASTAEAFARMGAVATGGLPATSVAEELVEGEAARDQATRRYETFFEEADPQFKALLRNTQASSASRELDTLVEQIRERAASAAPSGASPTTPASPPPGPVDVDAFVGLASERLEGELEVNRAIDTALRDQAQAAQDSALRTVRLYLAGAALGILAALGLALLVARATTRPLRQLTDAANQLAGEQLPRLVERLRTPDPSAEPVRLAPIPIGSRDEIGQLAQAINQIQRTTTDVAEEQASLLRKGISDIFVNLARRNQALLDRQIEFIDQLESNETDPDQLDNLFRLDHLATRMRRNAESLLVLAGADPPRRRGRPVPLADVVRVAIGEVEDFARVNLATLDDVAVAANVAVDLSHVVAELMDNATQFSPPDSLVEVVGRRSEDGSYLLSVADPGIGMGAEQLAEANHELAHPPMMGLTLGRSLGFVVIGRLAARHGISVQLGASPSGGVTALVTLPADLLEEEPARPQPASDPWAQPVARRVALAPLGDAAVAGEPPRPDLVPAGTGAEPGAVAPAARAEQPDAAVGAERANGRHVPAEPIGATAAPEALGGRSPATDPARADDLVGGRAEAAPGESIGRWFSTAPDLRTPSRGGNDAGTDEGRPPAAAGDVGPAPAPSTSPAWPALPRRQARGASSDGGRSFTYSDDGNGGQPSDTAWVTRLLGRPLQQPAAPAPPTTPPAPTAPTSAPAASTPTPSTPTAPTPAVSGPAASTPAAAGPTVSTPGASAPAESTAAGSGATTPTPATSSPGGSDPGRSTAADSGPTAPTPATSISAGSGAAEPAPATSSPAVTPLVPTIAAAAPGPGEPAGPATPPLGSPTSPSTSSPAAPPLGSPTSPSTSSPAAPPLGSPTSPSTSSPAAPPLGSAASPSTPAPAAPTAPFGAPLPRRIPGAGRRDASLPGDDVPGAGSVREPDRSGPVDAEPLPAAPASGAASSLADDQSLAARARADRRFDAVDSGAGGRGPDGDHGDDGDDGDDGERNPFRPGVDLAGRPSSPERPEATVTPIRGGRPPGGVERGGELTAAGLVRRSPKQQIRSLKAEANSPLGRSPITQRSPEEVRQILSRYRTGLQRGRTTSPTGNPDDDRPDRPDRPGRSSGPGGPGGPGGQGPDATNDAEEQR